MEKLSKILAFLLLVTTFLLVSCKDDVVVPPPPPPTPTNDDIYSWDTKVIYGHLGNVYVPDTASVYINRGYTLLKYDGDTLTEISLNDPGFFIVSIDGYDKDNVFLGGEGASNTPTLKKIQNGMIYTYPIINDNGNTISDVFCLGQNEAWVSTASSNYLYKFSSGNYRKYIIEDSVYYSYFSKDLNNIIYAFGSKIHYGPEYSEVLKSYKLVTDSFYIVSTDTLYTFSGGYKSNNLNRCGPDLIMLGDPIFSFTGTNWENYIQLPSGILGNPTHIGGTSKNYLILYSVRYNQIYVWDGNWHQEDSFHVSQPINFQLTMGPTIQLEGNNVYFTVSAPMASSSYFVIGRKNKIIK